MPFQQYQSGGKKAVTLLATCLVVLGGALTCTAIAISAEQKNPRAALTPAASVIAGIIFLLWLLRERPPENRARTLWSWLARRRKRRVPYRVQPKLPPSQRNSAPPVPPTAESVREIARSHNAWVPSASAPPRRDNRGRDTHDRDHSGRDR